MLCCLRCFCVLARMRFFLTGTAPGPLDNIVTASTTAVVIPP